MEELRDDILGLLTKKELLKIYKRCKKRETGFSKAMIECNTILMSPFKLSSTDVVLYGKKKFGEKWLPDCTVKYYIQGSSYFNFPSLGKGIIWPIY